MITRLLIYTSIFAVLYLAFRFSGYEFDLPTSIVTIIYVTTCSIFKEVAK